MKNDYYKLLKEVATCPSWSYSEDVIHPLIEKFLKDNFKDYSITKLPDHSLIVSIVSIPGNSDNEPIAIGCHIDKINHYNFQKEYDRLIFLYENDKFDDIDKEQDSDLDETETEIEYIENETYVKGIMDNSIGLSLCLYIAKTVREQSDKPLYLLLSSQEEVGMNGARTISEYMIKEQIRLPELFITLDTCPRCIGDRGVALYRNGFDPNQNIKKWFLKENSEMFIGDGATDYLVYSQYFTKKYKIPSIAIEPAVTNMHTLNEIVFKDDIQLTYDLLVKFITRKE